MSATSRYYISMILRCYISGVTVLYLCHYGARSVSLWCYISVMMLSISAVSPCPVVSPCYSRNITVLYQQCHRAILAVSPCYISSVTVLYQQCHRAILAVSPCYIRGSPCYISSITMLYQRHHHAISAAPPYYIKPIIIILLV